MDDFSQNDYRQLRNFLSREFGLYFEPNKLTYLENRVIPLLQAMNCRDLNDFIAEINSNPPRRTELLNRLTTNETWFFRHPRHFDILRDEVLPRILREKKKVKDTGLAVWSAGCSIGAELFSILITLIEVLPDVSQWHLRLIGTDISSDAVSRARKGVYSARELKLLSHVLLNRYFLPHGRDHFLIKPELQKKVEFEQLNLLDPWPKRTFDIIFCRNTMIYFHEETKSTLTERFFKILNFHGTFFTSSTETFHWKGEQTFKQIFIHGEYIYRKSPPGSNFVLFRFATPSDLLRALNLMVKLKIDYQLKTVLPSGPRSPKKALFVPKSLEKSTEQIFNDASLRVVTKEDFTG